MTHHSNTITSFFTSECMQHESHGCESLVPNIVNLGEMVSTVTELRSLPIAAFYSLIAILILSILSGSYFKLILYRVIYGEKFKDRPINPRVLQEAVIHHVTHGVYGPTLILSLCFDEPSEIIFGEIYCQVVLSAAVFGVVYLSIASFSIALFRLFYIRYNHWTKYIAGERRILVVLMIGGLAITLLVSFLYLVEPSTDRVLYNECIGRSRLALSVMSEMRRSQGKR